MRDDIPSMVSSPFLLDAKMKGIVEVAGITECELAICEEGGSKTGKCQNDRTRRVGKSSH